MSNKVGAFFWKLLERFGVQGVQFILQIILARLLSPEHYGVLSMMVVFTTLANVFIQTGFNTALIQGKDVTEEDYSSVFWVSLGVAGILYMLLFFASPIIANFYGMPDIVWPFRILAIMLFPGALQSVQLAKISREMNFKKVFVSNIGAIVFSGIIGIFVAYRGGGIWALVIQTMLNVTIASGVMWFVVDWHPQWVCQMSRVTKLFSFGWKLLASSLLDTLFQNVQSLIIGKKYDSGTLGYYNRGQQFPQFIMGSVNGAVQSVMLPAMSSEQENTQRVKNMMRKSMVLSAYVVFPMMAGLAGVARPMVELFLTEKWLGCVPYLQLNCIVFAFYPIHSCNLQAINAVGRSDIFLKLEIIKKIIISSSLIIAVLFFETPIAIVLASVLTTGLGFLINAYPNKRLIGYSYLEQLKDVMPSFLCAVIMFLIVFWMEKLTLPIGVLLVIQILTGMAIYIGITAVFKLKAYLILKQMFLDFGEKTRYLPQGKMVNKKQGE